MSAEGTAWTVFCASWVALGVSLFFVLRSNR